MEMVRASRKRIGQGLVAILVGTTLALWAFPRAIEDWQFQLAGLADPFLGRPAPGVTVILGSIVSLVVLGIAFVLGRGGPRAALRSWWTVPLVAAWLAYGAGAALTVAAGGQASHVGTLRYELGAPVTHVASVPAVCRTPVGKPEVIAEVRPSTGSGTPAIGGLPMLFLHHAATGLPERFGPLAESLASQAGDGSALARYEVPGLPDRVLPYLEARPDGGPTRTEPPIGFLAAYGYDVTGVQDHGRSGVATLTATRWEDPYGGDGLRWVNLRIPDDPWPESFELSIGWSC